MNLKEEKTQNFHLLAMPKCKCGSQVRPKDLKEHLVSQKHRVFLVRDAFKNEDIKPLKKGYVYKPFDISKWT